MLVRVILRRGAETIALYGLSLAAAMDEADRLVGDGFRFVCARGRLTGTMKRKAAAAA